MRYIDDIFIEKILKHGRMLITNLAILIKLTGIYESINEAIVNSASRLYRDLEPLLGSDGELSLKLAEDSFFIEDVRIKGSIADLDNFSSLNKDLSSKGIGAVNFKAPLQLDDLILLAYSIRGGQELSEIQNSLESRLTKGISVGGPVLAQKEDSLDTKDVRVSARRAYTKAIASYMDVINAIRSGRKPNVKKSKRAIQSLVDCLLKDEGYVLGLTILRNNEKYIFQHPVNVAIFAMALGRKLALTKYSISLIGMAALFHDIGKLEIPQSILSKEKEFSSLEMELVKMHPVEGVKHILRTRGINDISILSMIISLEHHLNADGSGYPKLKKERRPILFSGIVRLADDFDSLVSGLVYKREPMTPAAALRQMYSGHKKAYDPRLFRAFFEIFKRESFGF